MKILLTISMFMFCASVSHAVTWKYVAISATNTIYELDPMSIETVADNVKRAQYRANYTLYPSGISGSLRILTTVADFDCRKSRYKPLNYVGTTYAWKETVPEVNQTPVFQEVDPTTAFSVVRDAVCAADFQGNEIGSDARTALKNAEIARDAALSAKKEQESLDQIRAFEQRMRDQAQTNYDRMLRGSR
jgi:hypothetical protein